MRTRQNNLYKKILNSHNSSVIETALVQLFVEVNGITVKENSLVKQFLENKTSEIALVKKLLINEVETKDITNFVNVFELLIPQEDKKTNGAFFTPQNITDFIISQVVTSANQTVCDPSCGCGAFLIAAAKFIADEYKKNIVDVIEENIYGVDIADYSIRRAKILLSLLALKNGNEKKEIRFNLKTADSLVVDWENFFPKIRKGFDVIVGNPPYVKFQDLNKETREKLYKDWKTLKTGNYNLYFAFFELGVATIKPDGILGYITPNNYFTSLSGEPLREFLVFNRFIEKIIDFNHLKLFEAQTYTCITFLRKRSKDFFYYERVDDRRFLKNLKNLNYSKVTFADLNNKKWRLLRNSDQENIRKIETAGKKLGELVAIRVGIATCKDSIYFVDGKTLKGEYFYKTYQERVYKIEKNITHPIAKISDFKSQNDLNKNSRRVIFPYKRENRKIKIIKESDLKKLYPCCYDYLLATKSELATRDKGRVEYPEWYAYARTQGLNYFGEKLLTPTFSSEPRFLLEQDENALFCNGYAIYLIGEPSLFSEIETNLNLESLRKILNSRIMDYYIKRTSVSIEGGFPCYQKNFIELFGIPEFTLEELRCLDQEKNPAKIDEFLVKKYAVNI